jgi:tRNA nucleotidyltransferase (CCA-adding enzyme)
MNVGKFDSPVEHLPVHYRHIERGTPRIAAICDRFQAPDSCHKLALLALAECEHVHLLSEIRAGPIAAMLERLGAFSDPDMFRLLMTVCTCDFLAYGGHVDQIYPKATLLGTALEACAHLDDAEDKQMARAHAIAQAFGSVRWSDGTA